MPRRSVTCLVPALATLLLCAAAPALSASKADSRLDGDWHLDAAASDDFDAKLKQMAEAMRAKRRNQRGSPGGSRGSEGYGASDENGQVPGLLQELPSETRDELRDRLGGTYRPPAHLRIHLLDGEIGLLGDAPPERRYSLVETVTRMDVSGTSTLSAGWSGNALVITARYTNRARSDQRYSVDQSGNILTVALQLTESNGGKLQVHSTYRRSAPQAPP
jgi:hypothetical protein